MQFALNRSAALWIALCCGLLSLSLRAEEIVIANSANATASLTTAELTNILQGKQSSWPSGGKLVLVMPKTSQGTEAGLKKYAGFSLDQFSNHWKRLVFTGKGKMPSLVADDAEAIKAVRASPEGLALIGADAVTSGVKVLVIK